MADTNTEQNPQENQANQENARENRDTLLIAHVTAHLLDGTSFELYPFVDADDVKSKVSELTEGWASSGFLLRGSHLVPWQQVKLLEATSVEEISRQEAQQRLMTWQAEDQRRAVQNFWKTKKEKKKEEGEGEKAEGGDTEGGAQ